MLRNLNFTRLYGSFKPMIECRFCPDYKRHQNRSEEHNEIQFLIAAVPLIYRVVENGQVLPAILSLVLFGLDTSLIA